MLSASFQQGYRQRTHGASHYRQIERCALPRSATGSKNGRGYCQWGHEMQRVFLTFMVCLTLAACGLGETAVSTAAGSASEVAQAKEGLRIEARVKQQLDATATLEAQRRQAAEASSQ